MWPVMHANTVVVLPKFELGPCCSAIEKYRATILLLVPPIALVLVKNPEARKYDLSTLRLVISGAAPLGPELEQELASKLSKDVVVCQGCVFFPFSHICLPTVLTSFSLAVTA
jgi:acyl-CoA synthetase (AMP-forming)/AMP-acid ligase II